MVLRHVEVFVRCVDGWCLRLNLTLMDGWLQLASTIVRVALRFEGFYGVPVHQVANPGNSRVKVQRQIFRHSSQGTPFHSSLGQAV